MVQVNDSNVIKTPAVVVDQRFFFPEDVIDIKQKSSKSSITNSYSDSDSITDTYSAGDPTVLIGGLDAPRYLTIISQTARITSDGKTLIDVVLEVEDVPGATHYEIRVTKG